MALTEEELAELRSWVPWNPPTDGDLDDTHDRYLAEARHALERKDAWKRVAVFYIRKLRNSMLAEPATLNIPGQIGLGRGPNLTALTESLKTLGGDEPEGEPESVDARVEIGRLRRLGGGRG